VLNLFDIVRLYDTRDAANNRVGKTTMSEAQLIGRGARYCPFRLNDEQPLYQRKYDTLNGDNMDYGLKVCEELYYHSAHNPRYIQELRTALIEIGISAETSRELELFLKDEFKQRPFYKTGLVFKNERVKYAREDVTGINSSFIETTHKVTLLSGFTQTVTIFEDTQQRQENTKTKDYFINSFGSNLIRKALNQFAEYRFSNLKRLFPNLKSLSEFIESDKYLGKIKVEVKCSKETVNNLTQDNKLDIVIQLLSKLSGQLNAENINYKGTKEFKPYMVKETFTKKILNIANDGTTDKEFGLAQSETTNSDLRMDLSSEDWFAFNENFGTSEEKYLVKYIAKVIEQLKEKYSEVYLLRNERHFKLFNFDDGRAFEPDFVLFLVDDTEGPSLHYQVFIEPKGSQLIEQNKWKHNFLMQMKKEHSIEQLWKDKNYVIWGMPFFNETDTKPEFEKEFSVFLE
jgi:Uncharacterized protein conserved in bacteria